MKAMKILKVSGLSILFETHNIATGNTDFHCGKSYYILASMRWEVKEHNLIILLDL